jgi:hypothetical protein
MISLFTDEYINGSNARGTSKWTTSKNSAVAAVTVIVCGVESADANRPIDAVARSACAWAAPLGHVADALVLGAERAPGSSMTVQIPEPTDTPADAKT